MAKRVQLKRLSKAEFQKLLEAHQAVETAVELLQRTNWAGGPACIALMDRVNHVVCDIYNAAEASLKISLGLPPIDLPVAHEPEIAAEVTPDSGEKAEK